MVFDLNFIITFLNILRAPDSLEFGAGKHSLFKLKSPQRQAVVSATNSCSCQIFPLSNCDCNCNCNCK